MYDVVQYFNSRITFSLCSGTYEYSITVSDRLASTGVIHMKAETFVTASTKINNVSHKSHVTIDWSGMTDDDVQALAQRSLVIRKQNADRTKGVVPPERYTIKATDYKIGARTPQAPMDPREALAKLSPEEALALLQEIVSKAQ